jgi:hypothetical protein
MQIPPPRLDIPWRKEYPACLADTSQPKTALLLMFFVLLCWFGSVYMFIVLRVGLISSIFFLFKVLVEPHS